MQTAYNFTPSASVEGMLADAREACVIISKLAQGLVPVGKLCAPGTHSLTGPSQSAPDAQNTSPGQVIALPAGIVADPISKWLFTGIPWFDSSREPYDITLGFAAYGDTQGCSVIVKGPVWVKPEATFTTEKFGVWVRVAPAGGLTTLGVFSNVAGAGLVAISQCRWLSACNANGLAILEIA